RDDGRVALYRPDRLALAWADPAATEGGADPRAAGEDAWLLAALLDHLSRRGASFYRDLLAAALAAAAAAGRRGPTQRDLLDALWGLVWAGRVTNDTFAPLRALAWPRRRGEPGPRSGAARLGPP